MTTIVSKLQPSSFGNGPTDSGVNALRSLLALPTTTSPPMDKSRTNAIVTQATPKTKGAASPQNTPSEPVSSKKTSRIPSPQNPSPDSKNSARTAKKSKKKSEATAPSYFAGSAFQNSPDPVLIPMPSFDDDTPEPLDFGPDKTDIGTSNKTILLRRLLKVEN